jgi:hypothetical protein
VTVFKRGCGDEEEIREMKTKRIHESTRERKHENKTLVD